MEFPVFDIPGIQKFSDKTYKPFIGYPFSQSVYQNFVVDIIEESFDVNLDKPLSSAERLLYVAQCSMAALVWSETM